MTDSTKGKEYDNYLYIGESLKDSGTLQLLENILCFKGGKIYQATTDPEAQARAIFENRNIKVLLIDQYLRTGSGIDLMLWMSEIAIIPTLIIIMSDQLTDMIVALEAGADDAVYARISPRELAARVHAARRKAFRPPADFPHLHRRNLQNHMPASKHPLYYIRHKKWLYFSDSSRILLHGREGELLEMLITNYPRYISRDTISKAIMGREWNPSDRSIDNLISRLRKTIDTPETSHDGSVIETVRNGGYCLRFSIALLPDEKNTSEEYDFKKHSE